MYIYIYVLYFPKKCQYSPNTRGRATQNSRSPKYLSSDPLSLPWVPGIGDLHMVTDHFLFPNLPVVNFE